MNEQKFLPSGSDLTTVEGAMKSIEDVMTGRYLNVISGVKLYLSETENLPAYQALLSFACNDANVLQTYYSRLQQLANEKFDVQYENPHDTSIYLYARVLITRLRQMGNRSAIEQIIRLVNEVSNTFWSRIYVGEVYYGRIES